jgi:uncharacterized protein
MLVRAVAALAALEPAMPDAIAPYDPARDTEAAADLMAWRAAYEAELGSPRGWWAITGLSWLGDGPQRVGSDPAADVALPARCPAHAATLVREGEAALVRPADGVDVWLDDAPVGAAGAAAGDRAVLRIGSGPDAVEAVLLRRGERLGVRVYDPHRARARAGVAGVAWFGVEPGWVVPATIEAPAPGETLPVVNLLGDVHETPVAAWLAFELGGVRQRLVATASGDGLFVNFRDATSGVATYGAGRFLRVAAPGDGATWLDFHRAYHPPCAHTPHATCPLPPLANRLALAVTAGERSGPVAA